VRILFVGIVAWQGSVAHAAEVSFRATPDGSGRMWASVESLREQRWKHVIHQGADISCGSAALATLLNFQFDDPVTEERIIQAILRRVDPEEVKRRGGFSLLDLKGVVSEFGYTVKGYRLTLDQLAERRVPGLVPITIRGFKHFVVFRGVVGDRVLLADPSFGNLRLERERFERHWAGIAMFLFKDGKSRRGSVLEAEREPTQMTEPDSGLRRFLEQPDFHTTISPEEF